MIAAALLLATSAASTAVPPRIDVSLDRNESALGDRVVATYTARVPKGSRLAIDALVTPARPKEAATGSSDSGPVLDFQRPPAPVVKAEGTDSVVSQTVVFSPFSTGTLAVPGPYFTLIAPDGSRATVRAPAATLHVGSRLPQDTPKEKLAPRPERPVRIPAISPWWFVSAGLSALAIAAAVVLWLRRRKRGAEGHAAGAETVPPGTELLAELARLENSAERMSDPRAFYSDLTHVVKRYLERRLQLPVLEWTTFETVRRLREAGLEPPREAGLPELLSAADFVKFGKGAATRDAAREHLARARLLHEKLEAELARRAEEAARAAERAKKEAAR